MKISVKELQKYLDGDWKIEQIIDKLNHIGFPIDGVSQPSPYLDNLRIALIINKSAHPNNDELGLLEVEYLADGAKQTTQVVCGDTDLQIGDKAVLILTGETLPSTGKKLKPRSISGIESGGMLCSGEELGLPQSTDGVFTVEAELDAFVPEVLFANGAVLDVEVTYNRGDLLSFYGLARELASFGLGKLNKLDKPEISFDKGNIKISTDQCSFYSLNYMKAAEGMVELSNELAFELGQPTHVFDSDKIVGQVEVRLSKKDEVFIDLHGKEYLLPADLLVIADEEGVLAVAGVIGGLRSAFSDSTTNVAIEVAAFDKDAVLKASQALNINTDAAKFFTHGVDVENVFYAIGEYEKRLGKKFDAYKAFDSLDYTKANIAVSKPQAQSLCGNLWDAQKFQKSLQALGFDVENATDSFKVTIPTFRLDIDCSEVLVGEYLRFIGYNELSKDCGLKNAPVKLSKLEFEDLDAVLSASLNEVKTFKLISKPESDILINPITGYNALRQNLFENVLEIAIDNYKANRFFDGFYEIGDVFDVEQLTQTKHLCVILKGSKKFEPTMEALQDKLGQVMQIMNLDPTKIKYDHIEEDIFADGVVSNISYRKENIGKIGLLKHTLKSNVSFVGFELNLEALTTIKKAGTNVYKPGQDVFTKDFSFKLQADQTASELLEKLQKTFPNIVFSVFDVYPENYLVERNIGIRAVSSQEIDQEKVESCWK